MRIRYLPIIVALIIMFIFTTNSATAKDNYQISHTIRYDVSGLIDIERIIGHKCDTGAEKKQTIVGYGELIKTENIRMVNNIISSQETNEWSVPADAIDGLVVTTTIELCAKPMTTAAANYVYLPNLSAEANLILNQSTPQFLKDLKGNLVLGTGDYIFYEGELIDPYHPLILEDEGLEDEDKRLRVNRLTEQIWGTRISTTQGHEGAYDADLRAAYGPKIDSRWGIDTVREFDEQLQGEVVRVFENEYAWWYDDSKEDGYDSGRYYVGNYFHIDQYAYTSGGNLQRYISMSSPFSNALVIDKINVTGQSEVKEAFSMENLKAGRDARTLEWHDLF